MSGDHMFDNRQTQSRALDLIRMFEGRLTKLLEDGCKIFSFDARTCIRHRNLYPSIHEPDSDPHLPPLASELHCISDQVP